MTISIQPPQTSKATEQNERRVNLNSFGHDI